MRGNERDNGGRGRERGGEKERWERRTKKKRQTDMERERNKEEKTEMERGRSVDRDGGEAGRRSPINISRGPA